MKNCLMFYYQKAVIVLLVLYISILYYFRTCGLLRNVLLLEHPPHLSSFRHSLTDFPSLHVFFSENMDVLIKWQISILVKYLQKSSNDILKYTWLNYASSLVFIVTFIHVSYILWLTTLNFRKKLTNRWLVRCLPTKP
jgi:hypothetical protein